ncbi:MAG: DUF192 domain-containing protein [Coriobacteriales bacterium]
MTTWENMRFVLALSFAARARGLLGTDASWGEGNRVLVLAPCKSVHTIGMGYGLDIAFVDRHGVVLRSEQAVPPGRVLGCRKATFVLERPHQDDGRWPEAGKTMNCEIA